jgi:hypothetical protein
VWAVRRAPEALVRPAAAVQMPEEPPAAAPEVQPALRRRAPAVAERQAQLAAVSVAVPVAPAPVEMPGRLVAQRQVARTAVALPDAVEPHLVLRARPAARMEEASVHHRRQQGSGAPVVAAEKPGAAASPAAPAPAAPAAAAAAAAPVAEARARMAPRLMAVRQAVALAAALAGPSAPLAAAGAVAAQAALAALAPRPWEVEQRLRKELPPLGSPAWARYQSCTAAHLARRE